MNINHVTLQFMAKSSALGWNEVVNLFFFFYISYLLHTTNLIYNQNVNEAFATAWAPSNLYFNQTSTHSRWLCHNLLVVVIC